MPKSVDTHGLMCYNEKRELILYKMLFLISIFSQFFKGGEVTLFNVSENIMQMIFITIDEDSKENTGIDLNDEKNVIETACTGCYSGCVGSCLNVCSGSGKGSTGSSW